MPRNATSGSRATRRREDLAHLVDRHWVVAWNLERAVHAGDRDAPELPHGLRARRGPDLRRRHAALPAPAAALGHRGGDEVPAGRLPPVSPGDRAHADRPDDPGLRRLRPDGDRGRRAASGSPRWRRGCGRRRRRTTRASPRSASCTRRCCAGPMTRRGAVRARRLLQAHAAAAVPRVRGRHAEVGAAAHPPARGRRPDGRRRAGLAAAGARARLLRPGALHQGLQGRDRPLARATTG